MKVLHVTAYCHAGSVGGTERYILDLVTQLETAGFRNGIVWLNQGPPGEVIQADGVRILHLPAPAMRVDAPLPEFLSIAARILDAEEPDWLHFHTFGLSEAALAELAQQRSIPYAFTYHSPAWTCRRETMLLYGKEPCDGEVRAWRCSACQAQERLGAGLFGGHAATAISMAFGWAALPLGRTSFRRRTAFYHDSARFSRVIQDFLSACDLVISCAAWSIAVLERNGARAQSIVHCPQGVSDRFLSALEDSRSQPRQDGLFTVSCIGRVTPLKGIHLLMEGFSMFQEPRARLRIVGWEPDNSDTPYARLIRALAACDARIELVPKTDQAGTLREYRRLDLLAIPSVCLETGPLTLMEALAAGVPVYGTNRIGQIDLLREHGEVVAPNTPEAWRDALTGAYRGRLQTCPSRSDTSFRGACRTMTNVAAEHARFYRGHHGDS